MATNEVLLTQGTQLLFADHATDFGAAPATAANSIIRGTPVDIQIDLTNLAISGGARQSAKSADLARTGTEIVEWWNCKACMENETAPAAGGTYDFYWNASPSATAATGNMGGASGSDAAYTAAGETQMTYIGSLRVKNTVINIGDVGNFSMTERYGSLIVINNTSTAARNTATAMDETHIVLNPLVPDIQAAA